MLKSKASPPANAPHRRPYPYCTVQCVMAHLWLCITAARVAVDSQTRRQEYIGNMVLWARPAATATDLVDRPLGHAAELVSHVVARMDDRYFRSFIDFVRSGRVEAELRRRPTQ
ncbi:hypothetical protein EJB05_26727, partial [Eragrostis curvula]